MTGARKRLYISLFAAGLLGCTYTPDPDGYQGDCAADDPRVGYVAELTNRFIHGVSGTARIVDNCTIVIENFYYDGLAADPRWVGVVGDWEKVTVLSPTQLRPGGYVNETLTIKLPEGVTLDDVPMISLCCMPGLDFLGVGTLADGVFHAP